ncbi:GNAT family N-acetyltransferase [Sphingosinicella rhizophila]|uniref:N-acetyltransferase domain-containing protein n=1 Tax=Sphingosinicella rhizophila TaxID=3050082 RepID=A0ABU3QA73_9SPHN|nr:hypothetical protein [Sphingosinicella sp. GR2756]MDT9599893.1 hypothetical protein [Sphingosinicella sp. GR2756]
MPQFTLSRLGVDRLGEAYPLIRSAARVSPERWEAFAHDLCEHGGGVLAVLAEDGRVHGVAAYRPTGSLRHESGFLVEVIATFELSGSGCVRKALCAALEETARSQGCRSLIFTMAAAGYGDPSSRRRLSWEDLGLEMETVSFVQQVAEPSGALRS